MSLIGTERWSFGLNFMPGIEGAADLPRLDRTSKIGPPRQALALIPPVLSKYPPAEPGALGLEPLEAAGPCCINPHSYSHCGMPPQEPSALLRHPYLTFW